jgi:hypothetical protein
VFLLEVPGAYAELHPAAADLVDLRDRDGQRAGVAERRGGDEGAEPDPPSLRGQHAQRHPRVARRADDAAECPVVVGAEEPVEPQVLRRFRGRDQLFVG